MPVPVGIMADSYNAPTGGWLPTTPTGLTLWLDADDASTFTFSAGTTVSEWSDKGPMGFHMNILQATAPERSATVNGRAAVVFNNGGLRNNTAVTPWNNTTGACTAIAAIRRDDALINARRVIGAATASVGVAFNLTAAVSFQVRPGPVNDASATYTTGAVIAASGIYTGYSGSAGTIDARVNNVSNGTTAGPASAAPGASVLHLGHESTTYWPHTLCELLVYNRALTEPELTDAHNYLVARWGIT